MTQFWSNDSNVRPPVAADGLALDGQGPPAAEPAQYPRGAAPREPQPVTFTGSGREYFRIWAVNLCLSVLTLGLYSPWAKVRKLQYFYRNTRLAGAGFDYHGKPLSILKGRLILGALVAAYYGLSYAAPVAAIAAGAALFLASPFFFLQSLRFRMANTSYRGLRFRFHGTGGRAAGLMLLWPLLAACTFYLLLPHWLWKLRKFEYEEASYGRTRFTFGATSGAFYEAYFRGLLVAAPGLAALGLAGFGLVPSLADDADPAKGVTTILAAINGLCLAGMFFVLAAVRPYVEARLQRHVWSGLGLGDHHFACNLRAGAVARLALKNLAFTLLTFGLYAPYAAVAMAKLRAESVCLLPGAPLERLAAADAGSAPSAFADAVGDYADYDFGL